MSFRHLSPLFGLLILSACLPSVREEVFNTPGPTTQAVWYGSFDSQDILGDEIAFWPGESGTTHWLRHPGNEIEAVFPTLPNPRISLFVFPHITAEGLPIPGYTTSFHLYRRSDVFALPGEAIQTGRWR